MSNDDLSMYGGQTVMLTNKRRIALVADILAAAGKSRDEKRIKDLCEEAVRHLLAIVQGSEVHSAVRLAETSAIRAPGAHRRGAGPR